MRALRGGCDCSGCARKCCVDDHKRVFARGHRRSRGQNPSMPTTDRDWPVIRAQDAILGSCSPWSPPGFFGSAAVGIVAAESDIDAAVLGARPYGSGGCTICRNADLHQYWRLFGRWAGLGVNLWRTALQAGLRSVLDIVRARETAMDLVNRLIRECRPERDHPRYLRSDHFHCAGGPGRLISLRKSIISKACA